MYLNEKQILDGNQKAIRNNAERELWKLVEVRFKVMISAVNFKK